MSHSWLVCTTLTELAGCDWGLHKGCVLLPLLLVCCRPRRALLWLWRMRTSCCWRAVSTPTYSQQVGIWLCVCVRAPRGSKLQLFVNLHSSCTSQARPHHRPNAPIVSAQASMVS